MAHEALGLIPEWPNACYSLAESFYYLRSWPQVVTWAEAGFARPIPDSLCIMSPRDLRYSWIIYYTNALFHVGRVRDALEWTEKALAICPGENWHIINHELFSRIVANGDAPETSKNGKSSLPALVWHGPLFDPSGYAEEGREFVFALDALGVPLRTEPVYDWCPKQVALPSNESSTLHRLARTLCPSSMPQVRLFHMVPCHYRRIEGAAFHIGRTMCETDRIPSEWVAQCNLMDEIWVPCEFNIETFSRSGVEPQKLVKIPQGLNLNRYQVAGPHMRLPGGRRFNFLSVFEWSRRKGWDVLVRAFAAEFRATSNVALIIKTGAVGGNASVQLRQEVIKELRAAQLASYLPSNIVIFPANLSAEQMPALYRGASAFVLPSRGEGWGRPLMEAMLMGVPAIGTRWSGPLEFMNDDNSYLVDCEIVDVPECGWREAPVFCGHRWAEPSVTHLRRLMRQVVEDREGANRRAAAAREHISAHFSRERVAQMVRTHLAEVMDHRLQ